MISRSQAINRSKLPWECNWKRSSALIEAEHEGSNAAFLDYQAELRNPIKIETYNKPDIGDVTTNNTGI